MARHGSTGRYIVIARQHCPAARSTRRDDEELLAGRNAASGCPLYLAVCGARTPIASKRKA